MNSIKIQFLSRLKCDLMLLSENQVPTQNARVWMRVFCVHNIISWILGSVINLIICHWKSHIEISNICIIQAIFLPEEANAIKSWWYWGVFTIYSNTRWHFEVFLTFKVIFTATNSSLFVITQQLTFRSWHDTNPVLILFTV